MITETVDCTATGMFILKNAKGLHTRPCTEIIKCASRFKSEIYLYYRKEEANAKSMLGLLMLTAPRRARIRVKAVGPDAEEALDALLTLGNHAFHIDY